MSDEESEELRQAREDFEDALEEAEEEYGPSISIQAGGRTVFSQPVVPPSLNENVCISAGQYGKGEIEFECSNPPLDTKKLRETFEKIVVVSSLESFAKDVNIRAKDAINKGLRENDENLLFSGKALGLLAAIAEQLIETEED
jgi:hypothetical protein